MLEKKAFWNIVGKGEHAGGLHFLFCSKYFLPYRSKFQIFSHIYLVVCKMNAVN